VNAPNETKHRCATGIEGLDHVVGGGLPANRLYLVQGDPGVGKTTLGLQFLLEGVRLGQVVLYITLSETKEELLAVAESHGWDLSKVELFEMASIQEGIGEEMDNTFFRPSEVELNKITTALLAAVERLAPERVVFDSLSELRLLAETSLRYRRQVLQLKRYFAEHQCTVMFLDDLVARAGDGLVIESIAHGVIRLMSTAPDYGVSRRQLHVQKIRGVSFREGNHDFILRRGGMVVFPRLVAAEHHVAYARETFPSGIAGLDAVLGGGLDRGTSNMFMGPAGSGKSTLATKFLLEAATRGERGQLFTFDETIETLLGRSAQLGMDLRPFVANKSISIQQINPAEISPGELSHRIAHGVLSEGTRIVVIDSINGYMNALNEEHHLDLHLHELLAFLNQQGVISIMVLAQQGLANLPQSAVDLSYLADTVVLLRYFEDHGTVKQAVSVIKKRSGPHERTMREVNVGSDGIIVGEPLLNVHGVLQYVPEAVADPKGSHSTKAKR
jgi:circadian clock protein KaiC